LIELGYYGIAAMLFGSSAGATSIYFSWPVWIFSSLASDGLLANAAGKFFLQSRRSGQLELLLTTPLGAREILSGQWRAFKGLLGGPVAIILLAVMLMTVIELQGSSQDSLSTSFRFFVSVGLNIGVCLTGIIAVCWVAMW